MPQEKPSVRAGKTTGTISGDAELIPLTLRLPRVVHARLKELSDAEYRSLNHQIILALSYFVDLHEKLGWLPHPDHLRKNLGASSQNAPTWLNKR